MKNALIALLFMVCAASCRKRVNTYTCHCSTIINTQAGIYRGYGANELGKIPAEEAYTKCDAMKPDSLSDCYLSSRKVYK